MQCGMSRPSAPIHCGIVGVEGLKGKETPVPYRFQDTIIKVLIWGWHSSIYLLLKVTQGETNKEEFGNRWMGLYTLVQFHSSWIAKWINSLANKEFSHPQGFKCVDLGRTRCMCHRKMNPSANSSLEHYLVKFIQINCLFIVRVV